MRATLIIISGVIILIIGWFYYQQWISEEVIPSEKNTVKLNLSNNQSVFLKAKTWGISGNHEEIVLSETEPSTTDKAKDYIFYTSKVYYKTEEGKVIIYAPESLTSQPINKFDNIEVEIIDLKTAGEISNYEKNYRKYGLNIISVYPASP